MEENVASRIPMVTIHALKHHCLLYLGILCVPESLLKMNIIPKKWLQLKPLKVNCLVNSKTDLGQYINLMYLFVTFIEERCSYLHI